MSHILLPDWKDYCLWYICCEHYKSSKYIIILDYESLLPVLYNRNRDRERACKLFKRGLLKMPWELISKILRNLERSKYFSPSLSFFLGAISIAPSSPILSGLLYTAAQSRRCAAGAAAGLSLPDLIRIIAQTWVETYRDLPWLLGDFTTILNNPRNLDPNLKWPSVSQSLRVAQTWWRNS